MSEANYLKQEMEQNPEPEYINDLRVLRRFVQNGSLGFKQSDEVVFHRLKVHYPRAYSAFGEERRRETIEKYEHSPYIDEQKRTHPNNPDKDDYLKA